MSDEILTVAEAARLLRVSTATLERSIREGRCPVPVIRVGKTRGLRISRRQIELALAGQPTGGAA
jgi:excisionase family DNA binding protein